ncbi:hypothetical protein [Patulibacter defluvii]|uniref:hypothetical protein n=1 Tax=Patulibacter defluvii TaxID=3095358 RepID=UPI002A76657E|nr:hypothetical protein [Patulibacter sp. DM4]
MSPNLDRSVSASTGTGDHPSATGGNPPPGERALPELSPPDDPAGIGSMRLLVAMPAIVLVVTVVMALSAQVGIGLAVVALLAVVGGAAYIVTMLMQMTATDQPEPTARSHDDDPATPSAEPRPELERPVLGQRPKRPLLHY